MDRDEVLAQLQKERRRLGYDGDVLEAGPLLTRLRSSDGSHYNVVYSSLSRFTADSAIAGEIEYHRGLGVGFEWKLYAHDTPADLMDRLKSNGFVIGPREAVLAYDLKNTISCPAAISVTRVERIEQIADYRQVAEKVFEKDYQFTANQLAEAIRNGSVQNRGYIAYTDGIPVSIGRLYTHPNSAFGGLYGGGTLADYRGRGFYHAIVAARASDAAAAGARWLIVDALPTSRPILEHIGFEHITDTWPCQWKPG
jgi:hypothetical protein